MEMIDHFKNDENLYRIIHYPPLIPWEKEPGVFSSCVYKSDDPGCSVDRELSREENEIIHCIINRENRISALAAVEAKVCTFEDYDDVEDGKVIHDPICDNFYHAQIYRCSRNNGELKKISGGQARILAKCSRKVEHPDIG